MKTLKILYLITVIAILSVVSSFGLTVPTQPDPVTGLAYMNMSTFNITLLNITTGQFLGNSTTSGKAPIVKYYGLRLFTINAGSSVTTAIKYTLYDAKTYAEVTIASRIAHIIDSFTISSVNVDAINNGTSADPLAITLRPFLKNSSGNLVPYFPVEGIWIVVNDANGNYSYQSGNTQLWYRP